MWDKADSFAAHVDDTLVAGAGLCDLAATQFVVEQAPNAIAWLQTLGVPFSEEDGQLHLTREGGHSARRIVHATDATGAAVQRTLIERVQTMPGLLTMSLTPIGGGVPLMIGSDCVGAIGVSGGTPQQDEEIASAGARLLSTLNAG